VPAWNHNLHYHPLILRALPDPCASALDVGCGEGALARELAGRAKRVVAIDRHAPTLALARRHDVASNVELVLGDFLTHAFEPCSFEAVVSIAALHHMGMAPALERMRALVQPGGALAVVGIARSRSPADFAFDAAGFVVHRVLARTRTPWESAAPTLWPPPETYTEARRIAERVLPGVRFRRHVLFRYSLLWTKPR
jgi:2-polyprenyl-3-methyl-5-hydroxy-6-metoxy-1,4-benzoquinol methylase